MQRKIFLMVLRLWIFLSSSTFLRKPEVERAEAGPCLKSEDMASGSRECFVMVDKRIELLTAGRVVFGDLLGITYSIKASSPGYYNQTMKVTLKNREQTKRVALKPVPFLETALGKATIASGVTSVILVAAFIVLRRRRPQRTLRRRRQPSYRPYR